MILIPLLLAGILTVFFALLLIGAWTTGSWGLFVITLMAGLIVIGIPAVIVLSLLFHVVWACLDARDQELSPDDSRRILAE